MAFNAGAVQVTLIINGQQFVGQIRSVTVGLQNLNKHAHVAASGVSSLQVVFNTATGFARTFLGGVLQLAAGFGIATGATALLRQVIGTITGTFKAAFSAVEQFREGALEVGALITSLSADPSAKTFAQNLEFARGALIRLQLQAAKFGVSAFTINQALRAFVTFGVIPETRGAELALAQIARTIQAVTRGQNLQFQIWQEIRGIMTGMIQPGSILSRIIQRQVGDLNKWVREQRAAGTLLQSLANIMQGFNVAQVELNNLVSTWRATLSTIFAIISQAAFAGVYKDIAALLRTISRRLIDQEGQLTDLGKTVTLEIAVAWEVVKFHMEAAFEFLKDKFPPILKDIKGHFRDIAALWELMSAPLGLDILERHKRFLDIISGKEVAPLPVSRSLAGGPDSLEERIRRTRERTEALLKGVRIRASATVTQIDEAQLKLEEKLLERRARAAETSALGRLRVLDHEMKLWRSVATGNQRLLSLIEQVGSEERQKIVRDFTDKAIEEYDRLVKSIKVAQRDLQRIEFDRLGAVSNLRESVLKAETESLRTIFDIEKDRADKVETFIRDQMEALRDLRKERLGIGFLPSDIEIVRIDRALAALQERLLKLFDPRPALEMRKALAQLELQAVEGQIELQKTIVATAQDPKAVAQALTELSRLFQERAKLQAQASIDASQIEREARKKAIEEEIRTLQDTRKERIEAGFLPTDPEIRSIDLKLEHLRDQLGAVIAPSDEVKTKVTRFFSDAVEQIRALVQPTQETFAKIRQEAIADTLDPLIKKFRQLKDDVKSVFDYLVSQAPRVRDALKPLIDDLGRILRVPVPTQPQPTTGAPGTAVIPTVPVTSAALSPEVENALRRMGLPGAPFGLSSVRAITGEATPRAAVIININGQTIEIPLSKFDLFMEMLDFMLTDPAAKQQIEQVLSRGNL